MRFWALPALVAPLMMSGCGDVACSLPEDPRARADELMEGCFTGRTQCEGSRVSRIEGIETVAVENWSQIRACGRSVQFDRIEERRHAVTVIYVCGVDELVAEYRVSFSANDPKCEDVAYRFYRREEYEAR